MLKQIAFSSLLLALPLAHAQQSQPLEIMITGGLVPVSRDHIGTSVSVITAQQIEQRNYEFVTDILRDVPGVSISRSGGAGSLSEIRLRGASSDQTLVLIDGIEANDPAASSAFDFAHLLAENIERIEVLRGAQSALWGSDAIGGVVNIITKSGKDLESPEVSYAAEYGSYNTKNTALGFRGDGGLVDYALSIQHYESDGFSSASEHRFDYTLPDGGTITSGGNNEDDAYENTTAHFKIGLDAGENLRFDGVIRNTDFDSEFDSFSNLPTDSIEDKSTGDQQYYLLQARYAQLDNALNHTFKFFRNESDTDFFSTFGKTDSKGEKNHYGYQVDYGWHSGSLKQGVSFALETEEDKLDSTFSGKRKIDNDSAVAEYRFSNNNVALSANLRHDDNDLFDNNTSWRLAASYKFASNLRLHTSYGTGIKNPTMIELYGFTPDFVGNSNLESQESQGGDIGIEFVSDDGRRLFDITYFNFDIDNLITGSGDTAINIDGESNSQGFEVSYDAQLNDQLGYRASYTYNDTQDANGNQLIRRPEHELSAGVSFSALKDALKLNFNLRHVANRTDNTFDANFNNIAVDLDNYTVADISANYAINDTLSIKARIDNLFDEEYEEVLGYGTSDRAYYIGLSGGF